MKVRQAIADFFTGGEKVKAARITRQTLSKIKKPAKEELAQLLEAEGVTRRHFYKLGATGLATTVALVSTGWFIYDSFDEKNPVLKLTRSSGGTFIKVKEDKGIKDNLYILGQLHQSPIGEQSSWDEYHELFKLTANLHRNKLMNKVHFEGRPFNERAQVFPLDLSRREIVDRIISDKDFFRTILSRRGQGGRQLLNLETLVATCFPNLEVRGIENPETFEDEYIGYMERVYEPMFRRLNPFLVETRRYENNEFEQASFLTPRFQGGKLTSVRVGNRNFNPNELLKNMTDWENAERHVDEQSQLRERFILENVKDGFVIIGVDHLFNIQRNHSGTNSNIYLLFHKHLDPDFLKNSKAAISNMRNNATSKLRTWINN